MSAPPAPRDLGSGLVLRWATPADAGRLAESQAEGFRDAPDAAPNPWDRALLRELTSGRHPLVGIEDFACVEDTASGKIVASSCLMHGEWEYDGIPFRIGRPEHVVTDHNYRNRGLIRAIFEGGVEHGLFPLRVWNQQRLDLFEQFVARVGFRVGSLVDLCEKFAQLVVFAL